MATITEDYCSKEIYRLLIEKGFDGEIHTIFDEEGYTQPSITHQMAMKWLREKKKIGIEVNINFDFDDFNKWYYEYGFCIFQLSNTFDKLAECDYDGYKTYEEAVEAALKYCLENLI